MSLANKYRPQSFDQMCSQSHVVEIVSRMCQSDTLSNRNFLFTGPAGTGKAQPLYSKVLTPNGFITMGEVKVGQEVITGSGATAKVSGVYPQGVRPIYEITLQDRTKIRVSDEHLNVVYRYNQDKKCREDYCLTTKELIEFNNRSYYKLRIDIPNINSFNSDDDNLPMNPYLLGAMLGDGGLSDTSSSIKFSSSEPDIINKVDMILRADYDTCLHKLPKDPISYSIATVDYSPYKYTFVYDGVLYNSISNMQDKLVSLGYPKFSGETIVNICDGTAITTLKQYPELQGKISYSIHDKYKRGGNCTKFTDAVTQLGIRAKSIHKHIPKQYLFANWSNRLQLLQGLFDTDGHISKEGAVEFSTSSTQLSEDFAFLVRSLGIRDTVVVRSPKYVHNNEVRIGHISYRHNLKIPNGLQFYTSEKHSNRYRNRQLNPIRTIVSIEYVGDDECQCIMVDHPDHTYISDDFIPTHNTTLSRLIAKSLNGSTDNLIEIDAASHSGVDDMRELVQQASQYPVGTKYKIFLIDEVHSLSSAAWQSLLKCLEEQLAMTVFIMATTNPEKIPETILSRVQSFKLSKISSDQIYDRLKYVIECENKEGCNITYTEDALRYLSNYAGGGLRDALTNLDKVLAFGNNITTELLETALDLPNYDDYFELLNGIVKRDNTLITTIIDRVYNSGLNFVKWFEGYHSFLCNIVKYIFLRDISKTTIPSHYLPKIEKYTAQHAALCLKLSNKVLQMNKDIRNTQYLQEVALSYLLVPEAPKKPQGGNG